MTGLDNAIFGALSHYRLGWAQGYSDYAKGIKSVPKRHQGRFAKGWRDGHSAARHDRRMTAKRKAVAQ